MHQIAFGGYGPARGAKLQRSPDHLAGLRGLLIRKGDGKGVEKRGGIWSVKSREGKKKWIKGRGTVREK